jgi:uncharacterized protein YciI
VSRWLKYIGALFGALLLVGCATAPGGPNAANESASVRGSDMWFVFLELGKPSPTDRAQMEAMQRGHIANFQRLFGEKKLIAAGPLNDPAGAKRGIVVVRASERGALAEYFKPDEYVREGYLKLEAIPCVANKALSTEGIDSSSIEEVRIVQLMRGASLSAADVAAQRAALQGLVDRGVFGAWYTMDSGPVAEILFSRNKDDRALQVALAGTPAVKAGAGVAVWGQWFSRGVLK